MNEYVPSNTSSPYHQFTMTVCKTTHAADSLPATIAPGDVGVEHPADDPHWSVSMNTMIQDGHGRIIEQTIDHGDGTGTRTVYDADGKPIETVEVRGCPSSRRARRTGAASRTVYASGSTQTGTTSPSPHRPPHNSGHRSHGSPAKPTPSSDWCSACSTPPTTQETDHALHPFSHRSVRSAPRHKPPSVPSVPPPSSPRSIGRSSHPPSRSPRSSACSPRWPGYPRTRSGDHLARRLGAGRGQRLRVVGQRTNRPKLLLHTTEGSSIAGAVGAYKANNSWPHVTVDPIRKTRVQHVPLTKPARALRNSATPAKRTGHPPSSRSRSSDVPQSHTTGLRLRSSGSAERSLARCALPPRSR